MRRPRLVEVDVHLVVLVLRPSDAQPHDQTAVRQPIERRQPLGELDRAVVAADEDPGAERDPFRPGRCCRQQLERRPRRAVGLGNGHARAGGVRSRRLEGEEEVLLHPQAGEAELPRRVAESTDGVAGDVVTELGEREPDAERLNIGYGRASIVTVPRLPLTVIVAPSGMRLVASAIDGTHGMPSSRLTITAWVPTAPMSVTTAPATRNSGVHDGSVDGAIEDVAGLEPRRVGQIEQDRGRAGGVARRPGDARSARRRAAPARPARSPLRLHSLSGGAAPSTMYGGSSL